MIPRHVLALLFALALGCGADEGPQQSPTTPSRLEAPPSPLDATAAYELHEWGLIDVDLTTRRFELAAGPGHTRAPRPQPSPGPRYDIAAPGKPVIYAHLRDASPDVRFDLTVHLGAVRLAEHWPAGAASEHGVRWENIALRREHCAGGPYPTAADPICANVPDGYCEAAELADYVAEDAGCITIGGVDQSLLFYRGEGPIPALPVEIERTADGTVELTNTRMAVPVGAALRLRRQGDGSILVREVPLPARGASVSIAVPTEAANDGQRSTVRAALSALGLSAAEAAAFERAWFGELFEGTAPTPHRFADAVLFFLPEGEVDAYARLEAQPPPAAVRRAMAIRAGWPGL